MGDSDDDYDKGRRRDKFQSERRDYGGGGDNRSRQYQPRSGGGTGGGYYDSRQQQRVYPQRDSGSEPQQKRLRGDWDTYDPYDPQPKSQQPPSSAASGGTAGGTPVATKAPYMMTFKQFLGSQDDSITDEEAIAKYQEYKLEFKRQELHKFFIGHKDEEWFKLKYQPGEADKQKKLRLEKIRKRLEIFQELKEKGWIDRCNLDQDNSRMVEKVLDALVVKLEGGTDEDMVKLEEMDSEDDTMDSGDTSILREQKRRSTGDGSARPRSVDETPAAAADKLLTEAAKEQPTDSDDDTGAVDDDEEKKAENGEQPPPAAVNGDAKKEHQPSAVANEDGALSDSGSEKDANEPEKPAVDRRRSTSKTKETPRARVVSGDEKPPERRTRRRRGDEMLLHRTYSIFLRNIAPTITISEIEQLCKRFPGYLRVGLAEPLPERKFYRRGWVSFRRDVAIKEICWNLNNIRLRDCDLGAIVNRDLVRRVRGVNGITVHRPVAQADLRIAAKLVQIYDTKAGLWQETDEAESTADEGKKQAKKFADLPDGAQVDFGIVSNNPLLENITDYLIEEASAEEEELLGQGGAAHDADGDSKTPLERDDNLLKVLDRIILYLRLVHSVDYYNHGEYPHEDDMPNRCGLIHVRQPPPTANQWGADDNGNALVSQQFVTEFIKSFETRIKPMLDMDDRVAESEVKKLGKKDPEKEVEAFVTANCQELAKDKWLCPLSGKKFKGPEFVRKHIYTKHLEKLEEVRTEVAFFNNFLFDAKRPSIPEPQIKPLLGGGGGTPSAGGAGAPQPLVVPGNAQQPPYDLGSSAHQPQQRWNDRNSGGGYDRSYNRGGYNRNYAGGRGGGYQNYQNYGGQRNYPPRQVQNWAGDGQARGRRDPREPITYKDLDAPEDVY